MKRFLIAGAIAVVSLATPALAADVGVSVSIGQPGFYGRLDIGDYPYPQPRLIYSQPRVISRVSYASEPIYLRVPPGHRNNWGKHCRKYNACGERVYFVQDSWYSSEYAPRYRERHGGHWDNDRGESNDDHYGDRGNNGQGNNHDRGRHN